MSTRPTPITGTKSKPARTRKPHPETMKPVPPSKVRKIAEGLWWVESQRHPGTGHRVTRDACTCPAAQYGRPTCRHRVIVREIEAWREREAQQQQGSAVVVQPAPVPVVAGQQPVVTGKQTGELRPLSAWFE